MRLVADRFASPIGAIVLVHDGAANLRALDFEDCEARMLRLLRLQYGAVALTAGVAPLATTDALRAYFGGALDALDGIAVVTGGTVFQRTVWAALRQIPARSTCSYVALARSIGAATAVRAVGGANGANPVAIVVPCHRVIGAAGDLTGFGGGLERKRWLLAHEGVAIRPERQAVAGQAMIALGR